jgi:hypothetical protein
MHLATSGQPIILLLTLVVTSFGAGLAFAVYSDLSLTSHTPNIGSNGLVSNFTTTNTSPPGVSTGFGASINIQPGHGRVLMLCNVITSASVAYGSVVISVYRTSGPIPSAGTSVPPSSIFSVNMQLTSTTAGLGVAHELTNIDGPGVPPGTWNYYYAIYTVQPGVATLYGNSLTTIVLQQI